MVDGGKGQLNVALAAAHDLGLHGMPIVALAKEKENVLGDTLVDRVYLPGQKNPINLRSHTASLFFLARARDEAHRFSNRARERMGKARRMRSALDDVPGIGAATKKSLLKTLGSLSAVQKATDDQLLAVPGVLPRHVKALHRAFTQPAASASPSAPPPAPASASAVPVSTPVRLPAHRKIAFPACAPAPRVPNVPFRVSTPKKTILIVEDEPHLVLGLKDSLEFEGFHVIATGKGRDGVALARAENPDAVVLDLMLPDLNGYAVCEDIRRWNTLIPIIMLTARSQETDKIRGLDAGADDYITKPFSVNELIARLRAIFRRAARALPVPDIVTIGDAQVNFAAHGVTRKGENMQLSFYEVELLRLLYERVGQPVARDEILQKIWGLEAGPTNRTVDNFIVKLRKKIEASPDRPSYILTVYGFGYKLAIA